MQLNANFEQSHTPRNKENFVPKNCLCEYTGEKEAMDKREEYIARPSKLLYSIQLSNKRVLTYVKVESIYFQPEAGRASVTVNRARTIDHLTAYCNTNE